jgi:hypothetical protein
MKFLSKRNQYLQEAKIGDVILPRQKEAVKSKWSEEFLEMEEIVPTDKIQQGSWKLDTDDKLDIFSAFFDTDVRAMYQEFQKLPDQFAKALNDSLKFDLITTDREKFEAIFKDFNIQFPAIDAICNLNMPVFRKISVSETKATEVIVRDERGVPVKDEDNKIIKRTKEEGEIIYSKNLVNINSFVQDFNDCFPSEKVDAGMFSTGYVRDVINLASEDLSGGSYEVDYNPFSKDMYLVIKHNPKDILNMSVSKYYSSCQHLYTGMYRQKVIGNVFDPNTVPAFVIFDTPIMWKGEKISDQLPLCRMMIRNLEAFDTGDSKIYFDRCYPDRVKDAMDELVKKYTQMESTADRRSDAYYFTPDLPEDLLGEVETPYMDRLNIEQKRYIGVNTKSITLTPNIDWSKVKVSPKAKLKEIIIQSNALPDGLLDVPMSPDWIKFKFLNINDLSDFKNMKTNSIAFDKCKFSGSILDTFKDSLEKLQLISCDISNLNISELKNLKELHLLYTCDEDEFIDTVSPLSIKKLVISGDLLTKKENKLFINKLKSMGIKIEIIGPVL